MILGESNLPYAFLFWFYLHIILWRSRVAVRKP